MTSVIMPVRNESAFIAKGLQQVVDQNMQKRQAQAGDAPAFGLGT
jgi:glycosyltransferase involved in cell wall biosynthesis